jgi:hypothetical protein
MCGICGTCGDFDELPLFSSTTETSFISPFKRRKKIVFFAGQHNLFFFQS